MSVILTKEQVEQIKELLQPIIKKTGPYKMDPQEFAWSVMESSTEKAKEILKILEEASK